MRRLSPTRSRRGSTPRSRVEPRLPLRLDTATGLLQGARQVASPHWNERPEGVVPDLIIVHGISLPPGRFGGPWVDQLFSGTLDSRAHPAFRGLRGVRVSSHFLVRRDGELVQYVPVHRRAWHAGRSRFGGRDECNDFSVGIELEGTDQRPYTPVQYRRLCATIRALRRSMPSLARAPVVGHSDVAPGRKTDPGPAFDWGRLNRLLDIRP